MLKLKPNCEYCDVDLPPESQDARICSFECTFCASCVEQILHNVCANCGGGLVPRPIRPANEHREGVSVEHRPASTERAKMKWTKEEVAAFVDKVKHIEPHKR